MLTLCWSPKGGSGTTVVSAALAVLSARHRPTVLIDLGGDAPAALGIGEGGDPGILDWSAAPHATSDELFRLGVPCADRLTLIGLGRPAQSGASELPALDWARLADAATRSDVDVVVDAGPSIPPAGVQRDARSLVVLRPCYLTLRRAVQRGEIPTGVVLVTEPGRSLGTSDVERALSLPVLAEIPWDPAVARAVDAGLLAARLPSTIGRPLRGLAIGALR